MSARVLAGAAAAQSCSRPARRGSCSRASTRTTPLRRSRLLSPRASASSPAASSRCGGVPKTAPASCCSTVGYSLVPRRPHRVEQRLGLHDRDRAQHRGLRRVRPSAARVSVGQARQAARRLSRGGDLRADAARQRRAACSWRSGRIPTVPPASARSPSRTTPRRRRSTQLTCHGARARPDRSRPGDRRPPLPALARGSPSGARTRARDGRAGHAAGVQLAVGIFSDRAAEQLELLFLATFATVPIAFLAGVLRAGSPARPSASSSSTSPPEAPRCGTPSPEPFTIPPSTSSTGSPSASSSSGTTATSSSTTAARGHAVRRAQRQTRRRALHDPSLADEPELVDAAAAAAALWLENERLQAELRAQFDFLETIVNTAPVAAHVARARRPDRQLQHGLRARERLREHRGGPQRVLLGRLHLSRASATPCGSASTRIPSHLPSDYENTFVNRRGEELVIAWSTAPLRDEDGKVRNIICGGLDVTERKRHELELQGANATSSTQDGATSTPSLLVAHRPTRDRSSRTPSTTRSGG